MQEIVQLAKNITMLLVWIMASVACMVVTIEFIKTLFKNNK